MTLWRLLLPPFRHLLFMAVLVTTPFSSVRAQIVDTDVNAFAGADSLSVTGSFVSSTFLLVLVLTRSSSTPLLQVTPALPELPSTGVVVLT